MKYIKLFEDQTQNENYSAYDVITMSPERAGETLIKELYKDNPNMELVALIIEHSLVDVNAKYFGYTPLTISAYNGYTEVVRMLLQKPEIDVNKIGLSATALMEASYSGHEDIVRILLQRPDIDVNAQDSDGKSALSNACKSGSKDHVEIVRMLVQHPDINVNIQDFEEGNWTPLMTASWHGNIEAVELLLQHPDIDVEVESDYSGKTAYDFAKEEGQEEIAKLLLQY